MDARTFEIYSNIEMKKVRFKNRYGIELAGDLYLPENYDMSRDMSRGHMDCYSKEQRAKIKDYLSQQRWRDAESGTFALGNHEIGFDEAGEPLTAAMEVPAELPEGADPVFAAFYNYYYKRARHPRAVNFVSSWTATMPVAFWNFPLMANIKDVSPRPILMVAGENAHSRYLWRKSLFIS